MLTLGRERAVVGSLEHVMIVTSSRSLPVTELPNRIELIRANSPPCIDTARRVDIIPKKTIASRC